MCIRDSPKTDNEFTWIRSFWEVVNTSAFADLFRTRLIPGFVTVFGLLIPQNIQALYVAVRVN